MKKMRKKVLGLISLGLVIAMTFIAAGLPGPKASAISTMTDTLVLRVIGTSPNIDISKPSNDEIFVSPSMQIDFSFENVETVVAELTYIDLDGVEHNIGQIGSLTPDYTAGSDSLNLDLGDYGYGEFVVKITGTGHDSVQDIGLVKFKYTAVYTEIEEDPDTGLAYLIMHYDPTIVGTLDVDLYDENGELIAPPSPIQITAPTTRIELPLTGRPTGDYTIKTTAYEVGSGTKLGESYTVTYHYEPLPVPDTGRFFTGTDISKEDCLITGLIAFISFSMVAVWVVAKDRKNRR